VIEDLWSDEEVGGLSEIEMLAYQSRIVGADQGLVLWGGGNTSLKVWETDYRGRPTYVLRVKGSGSDLKAAQPRDFPGVRMDDLLPLMERDEMSDEEMVAYLAHALMEPSSPRPSIETLLHAFIPARSVVHTHADSILTLTNNARAQEVLAELFGDTLALVPYRRPGFLLSKEVGQQVQERPDLAGVVLLNHGLITWHDDPREAYRRHIEIVSRAEQYALAKAAGERNVTGVDPSPDDERRAIAARLAPIIRGLIGGTERGVLAYHDSDEVLGFTSGEIVPLDRMERVLESGAATPDHILNTKRSPLLVRTSNLLGDERQLAKAAQDAHLQWVERYQAYYEEHAPTQISPPDMLPPVPRVVLVENVGMFAFGKDSRAATISYEIYEHTIRIVEGAEALGGYRSLSPRDAFEAEYWPLELYKLTLAPPEKPLSRRVALVTGAAGAIGSAIARRFAAEGAHVVCADLDVEGAMSLATQLNATNPPNRALGLALDVTSESSVAEAFREIALQYGGLDVLVSNAGVAHSAPIDELALKDWERSLSVNATGHFLVAREALRVMKRGGLGGSLVFIATKNVPAPGKDFGAYSAAKAAEAQLARVLALEGGPFGIRSNIINPDAVFEGSGLWSAELRQNRARAQGIRTDQLEEYYQARNLLGLEVRAEDVAEAALYFAAERSSRTTGAMLPVDGGLREAFPR
jgi:rhamnulose-1-phosphate aldolase/alcohol dehydrogenase